MPAGRPQIILDEPRIAELAAKGLAYKEIAAIMDVHPSTLSRNYAETCQRGRELCNGMLRAKQVEKALGGSDTMLIWLGKQNLGQSDRTELNVSGAILHGHVDLSKLSDAAIEELTADNESGGVQRTLPEGCAVLGAEVDANGESALP